MTEPVDPHHLLLIGAGPGVGAAVVRRFGREGFRSTLISRSETLDQLASELRDGGLEIAAIGANIEDLAGYRETLERIFSAAGAPGALRTLPRVAKAAHRAEPGRDRERHRPSRNGAR